MNIIKEKFVAEYDFSDYLYNQIDYFKEDKQEFLVSILCDEERDVKDVTDEEIERHFYNDPFLHDEHWEDFTYMLEEEFTQHIGEEVIVEGTNMGWRNLNGHKEFIINKPIDVFSEISPQCDLTFRIEGLGNNKYVIRISHHDSPTGEYYELTIKE
tara:strand:+ start:216 stop:683 length:468 start_codon:yes stop_codon:yes gene_type:complete